MTKKRTFYKENNVLKRLLVALVTLPGGQDGQVDDEGAFAHGCQHDWERLEVLGDIQDPGQAQVLGAVARNSLGVPLGHGVDDYDLLSEAWETNNCRI